jgi:hypothetical protein
MPEALLRLAPMNAVPLLATPLLAILVGAPVCAALPALPLVWIDIA